MRKTLFFQKKINLFNVEFMVIHVYDQIYDNLIVFVDLSAKLNTMLKLVGMQNNIRQATTHKAIQMFCKFTVVLFSGDAARPRCTFLTTINHLKLTKINGGRNKARKISKSIAPEIAKLFLEIMRRTVIGKSNIARRVNSLRLVTDVR